MPVVQDQPAGSISASASSPSLSGTSPVTGTNPVAVGSSGASPVQSNAPAAGPTATPIGAPLQVPSGFSASVIANVSGARELAALPNGDLLVGTNGSTVAIVPGAEAAGAVSKPTAFATLSDSPAQGVAFGSGSVFIATQHAVWRIPYTNGAQNGTPQKIAALRSGSIPPNTDGDVHTSSSIAVSGTTLYVGVGSSCNACTEVDPTRATVQKMGTDGSGMTTQAKRFRNAIALATDPSSGTVWAGDAGQDNLPAGHPYEFLDPVSSRTAPADYGWPACDENHVAYTSGADCSNVVVPALAFPAYSTIIGAVFYPRNQAGTYAFPSAWSGGMYVSVHGSWHKTGSGYAVPPHVAFVPFSGDSPARPVKWSDPTTQWNDFFTGFQQNTSRSGRTTGVTVGASGSLFVADDQTGNIYRIRPAGVGLSGASQRHR